MMSTMTTTATTTPCTFQLTIEQELGQLFNTLQYIWQHNPHHFGHTKFDEFLGSLQTSYYYLLSLQQQKKLLIQQQQQQQQESSNKPIPSIPSAQSKPSKPSKPIVPSTTSPLPNSQPSKATICSTPKSQIAVMAKTRPKRSCVAAPKLQTIDEKTSFSSSPPPSSSTISTSMANKLNASAPAFEPISSAKTTASDEANNKILAKSYKKVEAFKPAHAVRAKLNIYIPKHMTKKLLSNISESFPNTGTLYYYLDISTALQINDGQVDIIETVDGKQLAFINFDLHHKDTKQLLYAVIIANDQHKVEGNKWLWKIDEFLTINEIESKYGIYEEDLPKSSRLIENGLYYQWKMQKDERIDVSILNQVNWSENMLKQIGSSKKGKKAKKTPEIKIVLNRNYWMSECRKSWNTIPAIPIVVYENRDINKHWIEWVKLIYIESQNAYIGISCKYISDDNEWKVESICLDKGDMHNKHRLIGLNNNGAPQSNIDYDAYFDKFNTKITEIQWKS